MILVVKFQLRQVSHAAGFAGHLLCETAGLGRIGLVMVKKKLFLTGYKNMRCCQHPDIRSVIVTV